MKEWKNSILEFNEHEKRILDDSNNSKEELINLFKIINKRGWIQINRKNSSNDGILGNALEDFLGVKENNKKKPDYDNYEIKTKKNFSNSDISLFCCSIDSTKRANTEIREKFGDIDNESNKKIFNFTVKYEVWSSHRVGYSYKLELKDNKLFLKIKDEKTNQIIDNEMYHWTFDKIMKNFQKIKNISYFEGEYNKNSNQVKFNKMTIYENVNFSKFIDLFNKGYIVVDFRIGVYKSGKRIGMTHDHGTAFRIKESKLMNIFDKRETY